MAKRKRITRTVANLNLRKREKNKQQQQQQDDLPYLPYGILLKILETLPAQYLYDVVRFVSKTLGHHILHTPSFIRSQLRHSDFAGFVTHNYPDFAALPQLVQLRWLGQGSLLKFYTKDLGVNRGTMCDSCDGVLLMCNMLSYNSTDMFLANPLTKQVRRLLDHPDQNISFPCTRMARMPETGVFKVVSTADSRSTLLILTVDGSHDMSWRKVISADYFPPKIFDCFKDAVCVEGVMYWLTDMSVFALDLHDESLHRVEFPEGFHCFPQSFKPVQMGKDICFIRLLSGSMDIVALKDFKQNKWVCLERKKSLFESSFASRWLLKPLLYLESEQTLLIRCTRRRKSENCLGEYWYEQKVMAYNMVTRGRGYLNVVDISLMSRTVRHTDSLVRL